MRNWNCGQNSGPGVWSVIQASQWRKLRRDGVTDPAWPNLLRGLQTLGPRVCSVCPCLSLEQSEGRLSTETFRLHSQKIRQEWDLQKGGRTLLDQRRVGRNPGQKLILGLFFVVLLREENHPEWGKSPWVRSRHYSHPSSIFLPPVRSCPSRFRWRQQSIALCSTSACLLCP